MEGDPETYTTVDALLEEARSQLERVTPEAAARAVAAGGAVLVDIRPDRLRARDGELPQAKRFARNVLEWRLDPSCPAHDPEAARRDVAVIIVCDEGYQSSLAAATLLRFGLRATDMIGGFQAWRGAGLPVDAFAGEEGA